MFGLHVRGSRKGEGVTLLFDDSQFFALLCPFFRLLVFFSKQTGPIIHECGQHVLYIGPRCKHHLMVPWAMHSLFIVVLV